MPIFHAWYRMWKLSCALSADLWDAATIGLREKYLTRTFVLIELQFKFPLYTVGRSVASLFSKGTSSTFGKSSPTLYCVLNDPTHVHRYTVRILHVWAQWQMKWLPLQPDHITVSLMASGATWGLQEINIFVRNNSDIMKSKLIDTTRDTLVCEVF